MIVSPKLSRGILGLALVAYMIPPLPAAETEVVRLWPGDAPGSEAVTEEESVRITDGGDHVVSKVHRPCCFQVHRPSSTVYLPAENATGAAVEGAQLQAGVGNLFDRNYFSIEGYPEPRRNGYVNLRYRF